MVSVNIMKIQVIILVEPTPKARPRHTAKSGRVITYTPEKTRMAEARIQSKIQDTVMDKGTFGEGVPIRMEAIFYRLRPKSSSKKVKMPVKRPDLDNYFKLVTDALEKYAYQDDSQITTVVMRKRFGSPPRIELTLEDDVEAPGWF